MSKRSKRGLRRWWWLGLILAGAAGGGFYYWKRSQVPLPVVQIQPVTYRDLTETVLANGRIQPVVQVKISPEVSGEIVALPVQEGQQVKKGDLLVKIKPDTYVAARNSEQARYKSAVANRELAAANLNKAKAEFARYQELFQIELVSASQFDEFKTAYEVAQASDRASQHQVEVSEAALARAEEELARTTIYAPMDGTIVKLNSEQGERVVGTAMMTGTEIMVLADLGEMEARVDIGEIDVVLIQVGQKARMEVDAFRDRDFSGTVTEIANSSNTAGAAAGSQEATRFEVRIRFQDLAIFRPGMSVTAYIETRYRTNVLSVPIQSVTTRVVPGLTNVTTAASRPERKDRNEAAGREDPEEEGQAKGDKSNKPVEVVFVVEDSEALVRPVKLGISDDNYAEITEGLKEGEQVVTGSFKAISRDLKDHAKVRVETPDERPTPAPAKES